MHKYLLSKWTAMTKSCNCIGISDSHEYIVQLAIYKA